MIMSPERITAPGLLTVPKKGLPFLDGQTHSKKRQTKAQSPILGHFP